MANKLGPHPVLSANCWFHLLALHPTTHRDEAPRHSRHFLESDCGKLRALAPTLAILGRIVVACEHD